MIVYYLENEIDIKYQKVFLRSLLPKLIDSIGDLSDQLYLFYRKVPGLIPVISEDGSISECLSFLDSPSKSFISTSYKKVTTIPKLLKLMNNQGSKSTLITSYNFRKRNIHKFENIHTINLGHSISGNTAYNLRVWVEDNKDGAISIVPEFFSRLRGGLYKARSGLNTKIEIDYYYYKLLYTLTKEDTYSSPDNKTILFLPHWTTPIGKVLDMVNRINLPDGYELLIKLHPASIHETTIFLNRTVKEDAEDTDSESNKSVQKAIYDSVVDEINSKSGVRVYNDDELELIDAIDKASYLIFDGHSNTLPEAIFRSIYKHQDKKVAVLDPKINNLAYVLPDLFGYDYIESIDSLEDFSSPNRELLLSYINVLEDGFLDNTISEYSSVISKAIINTYNS